MKAPHRQEIDSTLIAEEALLIITKSENLLTICTLSTYLLQHLLCAKWCKQPACVDEGRLTCRCEMADGLPEMKVNFDPALGVVLREVRYFLGMSSPSIEVPAIGLKVHQAVALVLSQPEI